MKTVKDACELQPNALSIKLSDQIEQLDDLITAEWIPPTIAWYPRASARATGTN